MLKHANTKGFTIIEVVITIAIGAAVMALVLNAVAGARRSQRNNARTADVGLLAKAINDYSGTRTSLPANFAAIDTIIDDEWAHYADANVNTINSWNATQPATGQPFAWNVAYATAPAATVLMGSGSQADNLMVITGAQCDANNTLPVVGGIREAVIIYRIEGQNDTICREV